jgi:uncharacterized protein (TIGR03032 family)
MDSTQPPFSCTYSPEIPALLQNLNCTLVISTYQAGKVIFISAKESGGLIQLPRTFKKPMGIAVDGKNLAIAAQDEVFILSNADRMAANYPAQVNTYDALYFTRAVYYTGEIDIHDLHWADKKLWSVNTRFSCLAVLDHTFSFIPKWKPFFVTKVLPNDQCHLNGVAFEGPAPRYVTALGKSDIEKGWKSLSLNSGILMDVAKNTILCDNLQMPHSPRIFDGRLFVLESASGKLLEVDRVTGNRSEVVALNGFARGMEKIGDYLFIGLSNLRTSSSAFNTLPIANKSLFCGVVAVHLPSGTIAGHIKYENSVNEIFDVRILPNTKRPNLLTPAKPENRMAITTPDYDYWAIENLKEHDDKA